MGFIQSTIYLALRYVFLFFLIGYHMVAKLWNSMLTPFEPIRAEARKVPEKEISLQGIVRTVTRLVFLGVLMWARMVQSMLDRVLQPVHMVVEKMSDFVEKHTPPGGRKFD